MAEEFVPAEIARAQLNSFHYLYQDAEWFRSLALTHPKSFDEVRICRTGILLYVFSLEALINRAMAEFVPDPLRTFLLEREENLSLQDKWLLLPMLARKDKPETFDKGQYPFSHFCELSYCETILFIQRTIGPRSTACSPTRTSNLSIGTAYPKAVASARQISCIGRRACRARPLLIASGAR